MKFFKKLFRSQNFWSIVIVVFAALLAGRTLLTPGYFRMHDDLQMMRQLEMEKCFLDLQIPCRWVPDMGYGFGFPLFNYYPPLPYLVGELFRLVSFSFVDTVKIVFLLSFVFSGISMYFFSKEFFGKVGGILSSVFYVWAPYHAVDVYVRGAMNEAWAFVWFPVILLFSYKLLTAGSKPARAKAGLVISLSLSWAGLFLSHNLMVLIFTPIFVLWCLFWVWRSKNLISSIKYLVSSGLLALGLTAFFTLPAVLEQKYVQVDTLVNGYYEYIAHFATFNQLFISRFWGYGPSIWMENDGMPFQIGHIHWILSLVIFVVLFLRKKLNPKLHTTYCILFLFILIGWFAAFMAHSRSTFIWQLIPTLKFVQFPWRFLTMVIFSFSFIAGSLILFIPKKFVYWLVGILSIGLIAFNWNYFLPYSGKMGPLTDKEKFADAAWDLQRTAGIFDYLPKGAVTAPKEPMRALSEVMKGEVNTEDLKMGTNKASLFINVISDKATVRFGIFKYPNWKAYVDGEEVETYIPKDEMWGRMYINVSKGEHKVTLKLLNTPLRTISNFVSLFTWIGLATSLLWRKKINY